MKITGFEERHFAAICRHFRDAYFAAHQEWKLEVVEGYIRACSDEFPELFFIATTEDGRYMGCAFGQTFFHYEGTFAQVTSLQVLEEFRGAGISKSLLQRFSEAARAKELAGIILMVDVDKDFPRDWYARLGFRRMTWVEYTARFEELKL